MCEGVINKIITFSSVDGPGNRTAIFLQGCNLNCLYCHNPETINQCNNCGVCVSQCPHNALLFEDGEVIWDKKICKNCDTCLQVCRRDSSPKVIKMNVNQVIEFIDKTKDFISGITVSGGECMLQTEFLAALFKRVKNMGLTTFIDSNGTVPFYEREELVKVMDMAMIDVKAYNLDEHRMLTGKDNEIVLENVKYLAKKGKLYEVRTVIVPEIIDNYYNVDKISKIIASLNPNIRYKIIKYRPLGVRTELLKSYSPPSDEMISKLSDIARKNGCINVITV